MNNFLKEFNQFFVQRRFSKIPEPYPTNEIYNDYNSTHKIEITLSPGDMLFIPAGWFHFVSSEDTDTKSKLNIAISFFTKHNHECLDCKDFSNISLCQNLKEEHLQNLDFTHYKLTSTPFILRDYFVSNKKWSLFNTTVESLKKKFKNQNILINKSKNKLFASNYIKEFFPDSCLESYMSFHEFIKQGLSPHSNYNYYLIQSEQQKDILKFENPSFLSNEEYANFSLWINFGNIYSSLHYDIHDNILTQIQGTKKIILIPPSERHKLHLFNPLNTKFLCTLNKIINSFKPQ